MQRVWPNRAGPGTLAFMARCTLASPFGPLTLVSGGDALTALTWGGDPGAVPSDPLLARAAQQLAAYFDGSLTAFDLPFRPAGGPLQQAVCAAMSAIPYGETRTYGDLAADLGAPAQAIGQACGGNPLPILIPCHRVLSARGLGGFSAPGGIETKVALLRHEGAAGLLI